VAAVGAAVVGLAPTLAASPELLAKAYYLRGTDIGDEPTDAEYETFMDRVFSGTGTPAPGDGLQKIEYNAGFWPVSRGGLDDLKWDASVAQGAALLDQEQIGSGDVVFAFSQGAVAASKYKGAHPEGTGATFILVENPNRPNGGVLSRFAGLKIPILDVTFSGATPDNGDETIDIARQYSGWSDFPTYPLNLLATANAVLGIAYLHGPTQRVADLEAQLAAIPKEGEPGYDPDYHQQHGNTTYYLIRTERLPLLMPFNGIVPEPILVAANEPLRVLVEAGYDRTDYSAPTRAKLIPKLNPIELTRDLADATAAGIAKGLDSAGVSASNEAPAQTSPTTAAESKIELRQRLTAADSEAPESTRDDRRQSRRAALSQLVAGNRPDTAGTAHRPGAALKKALKAVVPKTKRKTESTAAPKAETASNDKPDNDESSAPD
jgi:hypothetical protein